MSTQRELDEFFMGEAIKEAEKALKHGNWAVGCVIVLDGKIIAHSRNQVYSTNNYLAHAEVIALNEAHEVLTKNKNKCTLYATLEPCPMCFGAILLSKIKRVVYGVPEKGGALCLKPHLPDVFKLPKFDFEVVPGVLEDKCRELLVKSTKEVAISCPVPKEKLFERGILPGEIN